MKVKPTTDFSVTVMHRGGNVFVRGIKGESIDLDPELVALVNRDGDLLTEDKPKPKANRQVKKSTNRVS